MTITNEMVKVLGKHISNDDLHNEYDVYQAMIEFADQQTASLRTQLTEMTAEKEKWFNMYVGADDKVELLQDENRELKKELDKWNRLLKGLEDKY